LAKRSCRSRTTTTVIDREEDELVAEFDGRLVRYPCGEMDELVPCHATTIHKSQGSAYPVVVILLSTQHCMMLKRNLIYSGNTRGKRLVVVVRQKRALAMAVKSKRGERRLSKLRDRLLP
jgi:exodeoxyribonuclease V alpha subunit